MTEALANPEDVHEHYRRTAEARDRIHRNGLLRPHRINHRLRGGIFRSLLGKLPPAETALDIGTGTGVWAQMLCEKATRVVGVDFVEENLRIARRNARQAGLEERITYRLDDAAKPASLEAESFDLAMQVSVLQHLPEPVDALSAAAGVLKPGGHLLLLVHNRRCLYNQHLRQGWARNGTWRNEYSDRSELLDQLRRAGLEPIAVRGNWLFLNDLILMGRSRKLLWPLVGVRLALLGLTGLCQAVLGRISKADRCFREIVVLAAKVDSNR